MHFERLRIFVAVAEREHVTSAALALGLTQSAVSNAIARLEAEHQVRLFDRIGRGVVLNETGRVFLPEARAVLARAAAAEAVLDDLNHLRRGRVTVFASQTIASYWLPSRLVSFHAAYPNIQLDVSIGNTLEVARAVAAGQIEIGLVEGEIDDPSLVQAEVGADRLLVVVGAGHPLAARASPDWAEMARTPWVLRETGSGTRSSLEAQLRSNGQDPARLPVSLTLPSNEAVLAAVEAGAGATAVSESVAGLAIAAGWVQVVDLDLPERAFRLVRHASRYRSRAGDRFADWITPSSDG